MATHESLIRFLDGRPTRKAAKGVETCVHLEGNHGVAVQYHWTDVVTYLDETHVALSTGGWHTNTTRERMNAYSPDYYETAPGQCSYRVYIKQFAMRVAIVRRRTPTLEDQSSWEEVADMAIRDNMVIDLETGAVSELAVA